MENYLTQRAKEYLFNAYDFAILKQTNNAKRYFAMYEAIAEVLYEFYNIDLYNDYESMIEKIEEL